MCFYEKEIKKLRERARESRGFVKVEVEAEFFSSLFFRCPLSGSHFIRQQLSSSSSSSPRRKLLPLSQPLVLSFFFSLPTRVARHGPGQGRNNAKRRKRMTRRARGRKKREAFNAHPKPASKRSSLPRVASSTPLSPSLSLSRETDSTHD